MKKGRITRYFPGNNTPYGYFSFFDYIIPWKKARRIIIIKGGPGVGKSTMIRNVSNQLIEKGIDVEVLHCTADSDSLDGLIVKDYDVVLVDGTAPHTIDPKFPGCEDEILDLGKYWDEAGLLKQKEKIIYFREKVKGLYKRVYNYLKSSRILLDDIENIYSMSVVKKSRNEKIQEILNSVFKGVKNIEKTSKERHMFASGITPEGAIHFLDSLFNEVRHRFILLGPPSAGKSIILKQILNRAITMGFDVDVFHCPMNPEKIEHILIKELDTAFITSIKPHILENIRTDDIILDMNAVIDNSKLIGYQEYIKYNYSLYNILFEKAIDTLKNIKKTRNQLEDIYKSNMDFDIINNVHDQILEKILKLTMN